MTERFQRPDDDDARRLAQTEFDRPLAVEAGAGTGKTTVLVARILAWCLGRGWAEGCERLIEGSDSSPAHVRDTPKGGPVSRPNQAPNWLERLTP